MIKRKLLEKLLDKLHQPQFLSSFPFRKAWIGGQESVFKRETRKEP